MIFLKSVSPETIPFSKKYSDHVVVSGKTKPLIKERSEERDVVSRAIPKP
jgi:hypothetical protein